MTRDILLFGGICAISVDMIDGNGDVVRGLNEAYADATNINVRFDALPTKEPGEVLLALKRFLVPLRPLKSASITRWRSLK